MDDRWDKHFLDICYVVASMSKDTSRKVGCVIVRSDKSVASTGFNGYPRRVDDDKPERQDRNLKYFYTAHAEENAILTAAKHAVSLKGCTLYVTGAPCAGCARAIIQAGITEVVFPKDNTFEVDTDVYDRWKESMKAAATMFSEASVAAWRV